MSLLVRCASSYWRSSNFSIIRILFGCYELNMWFGSHSSLWPIVQYPPLNLDIVDNHVLSNILICAAWIVHDVPISTSSIIDTLLSLLMHGRIYPHSWGVQYPTDQWVQQWHSEKLWVFLQLINQLVGYNFIEIVIIKKLVVDTL